MMEGKALDIVLNGAENDILLLVLTDYLDESLH